MCGRFNITSDPLTQLIMDIINESIEPVDTRHNIAPTEQISVILKTDGGGWDVRNMRWWLVPSWSSGVSTKYTMFNAKSETLHKSLAFQQPFKRRRCLIPVSGYYEWVTESGIKLPFHIQPKDEQGFVFAGLWDRWQQGVKVVESCTIITGTAPDNMQQIHARIPIYLGAKGREVWLSPSSAQSDLQKLLQSDYTVPLVVTPVSTYVSNGRNKDARCLEPIGEPKVI